MAATADRKDDKNTALFDLADADEREPFAAFISDDVTREAAARMAAKRGWPSGSVQRGGLAAAMRSIAVVEPPRAMVIDLSDMADADDALDALAELAAADTRVIALGAENDVALFRRLLAAGVADYLIKPVTAEALDGALARAEAEAAGAARPARRGRVIAFTGSRGGVGASTLAANSAWIMATELERRVVLVDLDLQFGTQALTLDLDPGRGLREALEDPGRIDELFIDRAVHRVDDRLHVLAAEEALDDGTRFDSRAVAQMLDQLSQRYHCVVVDLPRALLGAESEILNAFTDVTVVSDLSLVALRDANRLIRLAKASAPDARLRVVANRVGPGKKGQIAARDFERALEVPLKHSIPLDDKAATRSANVGKPLADVAGKSRLMQAVRRLAVDVAGRGKPKKKSFFKRRKAANGGKRTK